MNPSRETTKPAQSPAMTRKHPFPTSTPLPRSRVGDIGKEEQEDGPSPSPSSSTSFPKPKLRLECRELDHAGSNIFFTNANPATALSTAVSIVLSTLYAPGPTNDHIPPTRSVTLVLRSMGGVAYTTGLEIDDDHKEIHLSLDYIKGVSDRTPGRAAAEIQGVLVHEMVHAWQWNALGTAPGGLIEGIADWVRGQAGLAPPHWKKEPVDRWDAGYQHTGYFLEWIEKEFGRGSVRRINASLKNKAYDDNLWELLFGKSVKALWETYEASLKEGEKPREGGHDGENGGDQVKAHAEDKEEEKKNEAVNTQ